MSGSKTSISKARSYKEMAEYWDRHDLGKYWRRLRPAAFEVDIKSEAAYYPVDSSLSTALRSIAKDKGVSPEILLNQWVQEKVRDLHK